VRESEFFTPVHTVIEIPFDTQATIFTDLVGSKEGIEGLVFYDWWVALGMSDGGKLIFLTF